MRWFKHMTGSRTDEKIALVMDEFGLEGYGAFWVLLEMVASKVDEKNCISVTYPESTFCRTLGVSRGKLAKFLQFFAEIGIFSVEKCGKSITIGSPNILKYRDEWTAKKARNSGVTPEKLRCKETDTDTDIDKEKTILTDSPKESCAPVEKIVVEVNPEPASIPGLSATPEPKPEPEPSPPPEPARRRREPNGTRIPDDWEPGVDGWAYATGKGMPPDLVAVEAEKFKNYWLAKSGRDATKRDWPATWRNWVLNAESFGGKNHARSAERGRQEARRGDSFSEFVAGAASWLDSGDPYPERGCGMGSGWVGPTGFLVPGGEA